MDSGAHRGIAYANDADRKARKNPVYFKWNPPALPDWALPKTKQEATTQDAESQDKKNKAPEPITGKDWNELQDLLKNIPMEGRFASAARQEHDEGIQNVDIPEGG